MNRSPFWIALLPAVCCLMALACQPTKESLPEVISPSTSCWQQASLNSAQEPCEKELSPQFMNLAGAAPELCGHLNLWQALQDTFSVKPASLFIDWQERLLYNALSTPNGLNFPKDIRGYVLHDSGLYLTHFFPYGVRDTLEAVPFNLSLDTNFPTTGKMRWTFHPASSITLPVRVRIPGWSDNKPSPNPGFRYWHKTNRKMTLSVDGEWVFPKVENGFAVIPGTWNGEHIIELNLPLSVRKIITQNPLQGVDSFALGWGPLLYGLGLDDVPEKGFSPEARWAVRQDISGCLPYIEGPAGSSSPLPYQRLQQNGAYFLPVQK